MDSATAKYLENNVGQILAKALSDLAATQPRDGVDFLAKWLRTYAENEEDKALKAEEEKVLLAERAAVLAKREKKEERRRVKVAELMTIESAYNGLLERFQSLDVDFEEDMWGELLEVAKSVSGATAVYLGRFDEELDEPSICYDKASSGSEWMQEKLLPKETGVTWGALVENPADEAFAASFLWKPAAAGPPPEPPADGSDPPPPEKTTSFYPVYVPCVTDVPQVHYFQLTRLGAYLAIPLVFTSYHTSDSYADAKLYEETKLAEEQKYQEDVKAREEQLAANPPAEDEEPPPEITPPEVKPMVLRGKEMKLVLCLDTLGTNTAFEESKIQKIFELCKECGQSKSRTENKQVDAQVLNWLSPEIRTEQEEQIQTAKAKVEAETQEELEKQEAEITDDLLKDVLHKRFAFLRAAQTALEIKSLILGLHSWVVVEKEVLGVIAAAALLCLYPKEGVYPKRKSFLKWEKLRGVLDVTLLTALTKMDEEFTKPRRGLAAEHKLSYIKPLAFPQEFDEEKAKSVSPAFAVLFNAVQAAVNLRTASLEQRKAEYEKEKAEQGEAWSGVPLEELDDDFAE